MKALRGMMKKISRGEGGFTLIELLIVIIILGILAAVVAFNVGGFLGQGTLETAKTEKSTVQTAIMAGMADNNVGTVTAGSIAAGATSGSVSFSGGNFSLASYMHLPTHGTWNWTTAGVVDSGSYSGGGKTCTLSTTNGTESWSCSAS